MALLDVLAHRAWHSAGAVVTSVLRYPKVSEIALHASVQAPDSSFCFHWKPVRADD